MREREGGEREVGRWGGREVGREGEKGVWVRETEKRRDDEGREREIRVAKRS